jgi:hypothetical protein
MRLTLDRALRIVWLAIGVLLLGVLLVSLVLVLAGFLRTRGATEAAAGAAAEGVRGAPEAGVRAGLPEALAGTSTRVVFLERARPGAAEGAPAAGRRGGLVNLVFLDPDGGARLLLDRPAYIREVRYPPAEPGAGAPGAEPAPWLTYEMALEDSDGDGMLGERDAAGLYVSDVDGGRLRPVVEPPLRVRGYRRHGAGELLVYVTGEDGAERALLYGVEAGRLSPFVALDSATLLAARIARGEQP